MDAEPHLTRPFFVVPIQRRQVWECGEKDLDESFFRVAKEDPLWADVVDPQAVQ